MRMQSNPMTIIALNPRVTRVAMWLAAFKDGKGRKRPERHWKSLDDATRQAYRRLAEDVLRL